MDMFIILNVIMVVWVHTFIKTQQILRYKYDKCVWFLVP